MLVIIVFSSYSYYARYFGGVGFESIGEYRDFVASFVSGDLTPAIEERLENIVDRGTYYLDALILMSRSDLSIGAGVYALGSLVELINLIPRALGIVAEQYSFDRYVSFAVWGELTFTQVFIGRIGESFFVMGFAGLLYALVHASIFAFVASRWSQLSREIGGIALYFAILQGWLYQDASLTYQIKNLIAIVLCYILAKAMVRLISRASQRAMRTQPLG